MNNNLTKSFEGNKMEWNDQLLLAKIKVSVEKAALTGRNLQIYYNFFNLQSLIRWVTPPLLPLYP